MIHFIVTYNQTLLIYNVLLNIYIPNCNSSEHVCVKKQGHFFNVYIFCERFGF